MDSLVEESVNLNDSSFYENQQHDNSDLDLLGTSFNRTSTSGFNMNTTLSRMITSERENNYLVFMKSLHKRFLKAIQGMPTRFSIFTVIEHWIGNIRETLQRGKAFESLVGEDTSIHLRNLLEREIETWFLILEIYYHRLRVDAVEDEESMNIPDTIKDLFHCNEHNFIRDLHASNKSHAEMLIIVKWLENNMRKNPEPDVIEKYIGWEQTLHMLKKDRLMNKANSNPNTVSYMDPDSNIRERKELHALDMEDDKKVCRGGYYYLRTGQAEKATVYFIDSGHLIRSGITMGSEYSDKVPLFDQEKENTEVKQFSIEGNTKRDLWKCINFQICEKNIVSKFERACRGAVCGHRKSLLEVANTWEDQLWSYLKTSVNVREEKELRERSNAKYINMPDEYWAQNSTLEESIEQIADSFDFDIPEVFFREIQKYIMLDNIEELFRVLKANKSTLLEDEKDNPVIHAQFIRFLVHTLLVLGILELGHDEELLNICILKYLNYLVSDGLLLHIPFYIGQLSPKNEQPNYLARLICSTDPLGLDEIMDILKNSAKNQIDALNVSVRVVEILIEEQEDFDVQNLAWIASAYHFSESTSKVMVALLRYAVLVTRKFITLDNMAKVKALLAQIDNNCLEEIEQFIPNFKDTLIREYNCYQVYMEAQDAVSKWSRCITQKPKLEEYGTAAPGEAASLNDRQFLERKRREFEILNNKWNKAHDHHLKMAINKFFEVLNFPKGWLTDCISIGPISDIHEENQISNVRRVLIPKVTFVLLKLIRESKSPKYMREFIYMLTDDSKRILQEFTSEEVGTIFKSTEEFIRQESATLFQLPK